MREIKKIAASLMVVVAMVTSITSISASAYYNEYSTASSRESSSSILTIIYAKNKYNSYSDFYGMAVYYNNSSGSFLGNKSEIHCNVPYYVNESIHFTWYCPSTLPATTRVETSCSAHVKYNVYSQPYETFHSTSYVYN